MTRYFYIFSIILAILSMNVSSSYCMEKKPKETESELNDCVDRVWVFLDELDRINPQSGIKAIRYVPSGSGPFLRYELAGKYKQSFNNKSADKYLSLNGLNLKKLPTKLVGETKEPTQLSKLKGCIKTLDLRNNKNLDAYTVIAGLAMFESEKDFVVLIKDTPLEKMLGKTQIGPQDIKRANEVRWEALGKRITKFSECTKRVNAFFDRLFELNPQMLDSDRATKLTKQADPNSLTSLDKSNFMKDKFIKKYQKYYAKLIERGISELPDISLEYLNIQKLPKEIGTLDGCIDMLDLSDNDYLTIESFPTEIAELKDVSIYVSSTHLEKLFGTDLLKAKQISNEKKAKDTGVYSNFALAPKDGMKSEEGTPLPLELRAKILSTMEAKRAQEREQEVAEDEKAG